MSKLGLVRANTSGARPTTGYQEPKSLSQRQSQAPRPKDAASLIPLRRKGRRWQVLMGRRHAEARFLPGYYVFPGGIVDPEDARAVPGTPLDGSTWPEMAVRNARRAQTIAMACIRETFEETGLAVCVKGDVGSGGGQSWGALRQLGLAPNLAALSYVGRAITPTTQRYRYHARFFATQELAIQGDIQPDGELEDLLWLDVDEALGLKSLVITSFMLRQAVNGYEYPQHATTAKPFFAVRRGVPGIWTGGAWEAVGPPIKE